MSVKYGEIATVGKVKAEIRERVAVVHWQTRLETA